MNVYGERIRKEWSDTDNVKLEDEIVTIAEGVLNVAVIIRVQDSADWRASENLRLYIETVMSKREKEIDVAADMDEWVKRATHVADELDPIERIRKSCKRGSGIDIPR
jgi:hypothetical protein